MRRISVFAVVAVISGCAPHSLRSEKLGTYEEIRPEISVSRTGTRLKLARAAHVRILRLEPGSLYLAYPRGPEQTGYLQAGVHKLDAGALQAWQQTGQCSGGETEVSAYRDDERLPTISAPRSANSRGLRGACVRTSAAPDAYSNKLAQVLVVASEQPLGDEAVEQFARELASPQATSAESRETLAARLNAEAGARGWAALLLPARLR